MRRIGILGVLLAGLVAAGCSTIISGSTDVVAFNSTPEGATVILDGIPIGKTPCQGVVSRWWKSGDVVFRLEGRELQTYVPHAFNPWVVGNVLFGGLIGIGIDCISGNCRMAEVDVVRVDLTAENDGQWHVIPPPKPVVRDEEKEDAEAWERWRRRQARR